MEVAVGITAGHGVYAKSEILYLEQVLNEQFGNGEGEVNRIRVICPITDPLGSFVFVHIENGDSFFESKRDLEEYRDAVMEFIARLDGVTKAAVTLMVHRGSQVEDAKKVKV